MIAIGVMIQVTTVIFALWYAQSLDFIFCESSFFGSPQCPDGRPGRRLVLYGVPVLGFLIGGIVPARLLGASWIKTFVLVVLIPIGTIIVIVVPIIFFFALLRSQS